MNPAELVQAGRLEEGLEALQSQIRAKPEEVGQRVFLFQLQCVLGHLDKALTQLQVLAGLNADTMLMARVFQPVITCELLRREVFAGRRSPMVFGEPQEWMSCLVQANALVAQGESRAAAPLRAQAFEAAPASPGQLNGQSFEWLADADSRLGPVLEAFIEGKYYWVPFLRIRKIEVAKPSDLRDLVWVPAQFVWTNGGSAHGHIPVRYPGTEEVSDGPLRLGRRTEWKEQAGSTYLGLGQRLLATEAAEHPLLECRQIEFDPAA